MAENKKEVKRTTITLQIKPEYKKALKMYAVRRDTTVTALFNDWVEKNCLEEEK
ncbi:MAG: hypothetical protein IJI05_01245 [Erysipelotrichaceae bacterium]|nr:hypothetical protein [Erysipelotrichaceae bacterium]